jgi:alpha-L-rhamnosidase
MQSGRVDLVLANIRERWGAMIAAGSTTMWEVWSPLASQCHAWSTTPTFDLSTYVLGITPLADGFAKALIAPQPVDLAWAQGHVPTPHGEIEVTWQQTEQAFQLTVQTPTAIPFHVILPYAAQRIEINGLLAWAAGQPGQTSAGLLPVWHPSGKVELIGAQGGTYSILATSA